jgi:hypothetical protein
VLVTAALAGQLTLTEGLLVNEGTALLIIANALRLLRITSLEPGSLCTQATVPSHRLNLGQETFLDTGRAHGADP